MFSPPQSCNSAPTVVTGVPVHNPPPSFLGVGAEEAALLAAKARIEAVPKGLTTNGKPYTRRADRSETEKRVLEAEHLAADEEIPCTSWSTRKKRYHTSVRRDRKCVNIYSNTRTDAVEAGRLAKAWSDAGNSLVVRREAKRQKLEDLTTKRAADVAITGDNTALERRCLIRLRDAINNHESARTGDPLDNLQIHIMCDGTLADALYRTNRMEDGDWLSWQHKTTHKRVKNGGWVFQNVNGYDGMAIICESEVDDNQWLFDGNTYHTWTKNLYVGCKGGKPTVAPIALADFCDVLRTYCTNAAVGFQGAYHATTLYDAERLIGKGMITSCKPSTLEIERRGVVLFIDEVLGGEFPFAEREGADYADTVRFIDRCNPELGAAIRAAPDTYRVTRNGDVFKYPEAQQSKTDLEIWTCGVAHGGDVEVHNDSGWNTYQFKSAQETTGESGMKGRLVTNSGKDPNGTRINSNNYWLGHHARLLVHSRARHGQAWPHRHARTAGSQDGHRPPPRGLDGHRLRVRVDQGLPLSRVTGCGR
jgi:hypothetical protein